MSISFIEIHFTQDFVGYFYNMDVYIYYINMHSRKIWAVATHGHLTSTHKKNDFSAKRKDRVVGLPNEGIGRTKEISCF